MHDTDDATVLVTGGAGFIGSHLIEELIDRGREVVVADDFSRGSLDNISHLADAVDLRPVDLTTREGCLRAVDGVDRVYHLAASVGGIHYIKRENVGGLTPSVLMNQHMLEAARTEDVDRFLFASSACIYRQEHDDLNLFSEDQGIPADPHSTYGWAKVLGEVACQAYQEDCDIATSSVRIFNCYGSRETLDPDSSHVIPSLCRKVVEADDGDAIELFGDGTQERGFIHVTDLAAGMIEVLERKGDGEPINLGNSRDTVSMNELAERIIDISGKDLSIEHDRSKPTGTDKYACDMTKINEELEWRPEVRLDDGLRRMYHWVADELDAEPDLVAADGGGER